jgi:titin
VPSFTVNTKDDVNDGTCDATHCSLREALDDANVATGADIIHFSISGAIPHTIQPLSALPTITDPVVIDGTTQPGFAGKPVIELDGSKTAAGTIGLKITAGNSTVRGLVINRYRGAKPDAHAIVLSGSGSNIIEGNFIGTDVTGTKALTNAEIVPPGDYSKFPGGGILVEESSNNTIGGTTPDARNVLSGNLRGIEIWGVNATGNSVEGNYVGTDVTGTVKLGNGVWMLYYGDKFYALNVGVDIAFGSSNTIGGTIAGAGNLISGNGSGVNITCGGQDNAVRGNYIGTDATGTVALGNVYEGVGISAILSDCLNTGNLIGGTSAEARNLISGNGKGVSVISWDGGDVSGTLVQSNYIGTDAAGVAAIPNIVGVSILGNDAANVTIGGTAPGAGNVISGNESKGVAITSGRNNLVQGNRIGTDATGNSALGNGTGVALTQEFGSFVGPKYNTVGGTTSGARNIISGNTKYGVFIGGGEDNQILGNYIGTNASGTAALGNGIDGIVIGDAGGNVIGGLTGGSANLISGNTRVGVLISGPKATQNKLQGNLIGTDATGMSAVGNGKAGVRIDEGIDNTVGGTMSAAANVIAFNGSAGTVVSSGTGNEILSNSIFSNTGLGIDLGTVPGTPDPDGMTPNDGGDGDTGPNGLQNFPVLATFDFAGGTLVVQGTLNSTANATFRVELFSNTACDASGYGEGGTFLASTSVTTDGSGNATLAIGVPGSVSRGEYLTATATDGSSNTSELSKYIVVPNRPPVADANGPYSGVEGSAIGFDGTGSTDTDGDALTFAWTFGDGGTASSSPTPSHTYVDNGSFSAGLQVADPDGLTDTDATTAAIANVAPAVGPITAPLEPVAVGRRPVP